MFSTQAAKTFYLTVSLLLLSGCEHFEPRDNFASVEVGMTRVEVKSLIGAPEARYFEGDTEVWEYCVIGWLTDDFVTVRFDESAATSADIVLDADMGHCSSTLTDTGSDPA